jgi:hypothetical protein
MLLAMTAPPSPHLKKRIRKKPIHTHESFETTILVPAEIPIPTPIDPNPCQFKSLCQCYGISQKQYQPYHDKISNSIKDAAAVLNK